MRETESGIEVKPLYTPADAPEPPEPPGTPPFTRGIYPDMYRGRPWTIRQYAGFASAEETNARFRTLLERGQTGLSVAFDLPTQLGLDSDDPRAAGEVGRTGVAIDSLADMEALLDGIPLGEDSTSMTINAPAALLLALYELVAARRGVDAAALRGTVQNDILKEYAARGNYIFPPRPSMRLTTDLFAYCAERLPRFNTISISGYHMREAGSTAVQELAFTIANGIAYCEAAVGAGDERAVRGDEPEGARPALPRADRRLDPDGAAAREQHRAGRAPGALGRARRLPVAARERVRRGARAPDGAGGDARAAHSAGAPARDRGREHRRSRRGLVLRRGADARARGARAGADRADRRARRGRRGDRGRLRPGGDRGGGVPLDAAGRVGRAGDRRRQPIRRERRGDGRAPPARPRGRAPPGRAHPPRARDPRRRGRGARARPRARGGPRHRQRAPPDPRRARGDVYRRRGVRRAPRGVGVLRSAVTAGRRREGPARLADVPGAGRPRPRRLRRAARAGAPRPGAPPPGAGRGGRAARRRLGALPRPRRPDRRRRRRPARRHRPRPRRPERRRRARGRGADPAGRAPRRGGDRGLRLPAARARDEAARGVREDRGGRLRRRPRPLHRGTTRARRRHDAPGATSLRVRRQPDGAEERRPARGRLRAPRSRQPHLRRRRAVAGAARGPAGRPGDRPRAARPGPGVPRGRRRRLRAVAPRALRPVGPRGDGLRPHGGRDPDRRPARVRPPRCRDPGRPARRRRAAARPRPRRVVPEPERGGAAGGRAARRQGRGGAGGADPRASRSRSASLTSTSGRTASSRPASRASASASSQLRRTFAGSTPCFSRLSPVTRSFWIRLRAPSSIPAQGSAVPRVAAADDESRPVEALLGAGRALGRYPSRGMVQALAVVHVLLAASLISLVLMHSGREAGLGGMGFTPTSQGGTHIVERNLTRLTIVVALLFLANTIALYRLLT